MELIEFAAARDAMRNMTIESRTPLRATRSFGSASRDFGFGQGFSSRPVDEIRSAWSYRDLSKEEWGWVLDFATEGGKAWCLISSRK